jgi:NADP-dependent 3-hydroxy acid dehydrogenase YdfG
MAIAFQAHGLHVFATARTLSKMTHLADIPDITLIQLDVTSPSSIAAAVEVVKKTGDGSLKYLVNNAGAGFVSPVLDVDVEKAKEMFETNFWGLLRVTKAFAGLVVEEKGTIVTVGSSAGVVIFPFSGSSPNFLWGREMYLRQNMELI